MDKVNSFDDLANGVFYWLRIDEKITVGQWNSDYGINGCFWICGCDEPIKIPESLDFSDILSVCGQGDWE